MVRLDFGGHVAEHRQHDRFGGERAVVVERGGGADELEPAQRAVAVTQTKLSVHAAIGGERAAQRVEKVEPRTRVDARRSIHGRVHRQRAVR
jgi:hypothetical protein